MSADDLETQVRQQVEFYLSDSNLPFDKFLFSLYSASFHKPRQVILDTPIDDSFKLNTLSSTQGVSSIKHDRNHLGWIPFETLCSFKRMRDFLQPSPKGLGSIDQLAQTLKDSKLVQAHQFGKQDQQDQGWYVRKTNELQKAPDVLERSAYAKGFPVVSIEGDETTEDNKKLIKDKEIELQKQIESFVKQLNVGNVLSVRMRREDKIVNGKTIPRQGKFKGSVFIEFADTDSVDKFCKLEPKPQFQGQTLETMSKADYVEMKRQIYAPGTEKQIQSTNNNKNNKQFNAWSQKLVDSNGFPSLFETTTNNKNETTDSNSKKRKAQEDGPEERDIMFDGVRFKAKRINDDSVELVDENSIGTTEGQWPKGRLLKFTIKTKGSDDTRFNYIELKNQISSIVKPGYIGLDTKDEQQVDKVQASASGSNGTSTGGFKSVAMTDVGEGVIKPKLNAPPTIASASTTSSSSIEPSQVVNDDQNLLRGTASFKQIVDDEAFNKIQSEFSNFQGQELNWTRATEQEERQHNLSRARWHAKEAFFGSDERGSGGRGRGGGRGGRGGGRGGRGGHSNKRQRR
ncbi:hypothetical protein OIO90_000657 [Microbotryomycetes sp. JL221]|nr:hypothetical protein OIO90_000657 [Microbotryomycetes sp. JL221]